MTINIPEYDIPGQLPAAYQWSVPVAGQDKNKVYAATVAKYPWFERLQAAWVKSIKALYFAVDCKPGTKPDDPRKLATE